MTKKALVTGASGFTGIYLCEMLAESGFEVLGLGGRSNAPSDFAFNFETVDLTDQQGLTKCVKAFNPDVVLHLAGIAFAAHSDAAAYYKVNVIGTENLLKAIIDGAPDCRSVVISSSANVYGIPPDDQPLSEALSVPAPVNHYACSKLSMEHIALTYLDRLPIVLARPFNYTGPGQDPIFVVPKIISHCRDKKESIELGNLAVIRDFSDVRDVAKSYLMLAEHGKPGEIYNLCSGKGVRLQEILDLATEISGHKLEVKVNPAFIRPTDIQVLIGSNQKFTDAFGTMDRVPFRKTIEDMLAS